MARANVAILHEAESKLVAKVNVWFDQTMERVSHRFTASTRMWTFACGLLLAGTLQLDTIALVNRFSVDDELRASLTKQAEQIASTTNATAPDAGSPDLYQSVIEQGVISIPNYPRDFARFGDLKHLVGILLTTLLLSLGAPFWFGALQQLLQLRSKIQQTDDQQRETRQSTQDAISTPAGPAAVTPGVITGESGDLAAVG
jgi:hypothetical protein